MEKVVTFPTVELNEGKMIGDVNTESIKKMQKKSDQMTVKFIIPWFFTNR